MIVAVFGRSNMGVASQWGVNIFDIHPCPHVPDLFLWPHCSGLVFRATSPRLFSVKVRKNFNVYYRSRDTTVRP